MEKQNAVECSGFWLGHCDCDAALGNMNMLLAYVYAYLTLVNDNLITIEIL